MTVYIVQLYDWDWENDAVFKNIEDAKKYIIKRFKEEYPAEAAEEEVMATVIEYLNEDNYIEEFAAIKTWEVQ